MTAYNYDSRGSLREVDLPDGTVIDYVIDGQARRVGKQVNGAFTQGFLYKDQLRIAAELDSAGNVAAQFTYLGSNHSPDYMSKSGVLYRFVKDQVGSVRLVVNSATGAIAQSLDYDEFGRVLTDTNPGFQPFGFAGGVYDATTGLTRFGARDYDPVVGRWTSKDPIRWGGGQENFYAYANNDPMNGFDSNGLSKFDKWYNLPAKFWDWLHEIEKAQGRGRLGDFSKEEADELFDEWKRLGEPKADNKRGGTRKKDFGWDDIFEMLIPLPWPDFLDPCVVSPEMCTCGPTT
jgi:RHS repeat-associated protein